MSANFIVEKWNVIDSAEMAVSVASVLYRLLNNKKLPFDFDEAMKRGIAFLEEAKKGGAILCGDSKSNDFTGTLSPMRWSTDVCLIFEANREEMDLYSDVVLLLSNYGDLLRRLNVKKIIDGGTDTDLAKEAYKFFDALASILMEQADPITETYSHQATV